MYGGHLAATWNVCHDLRDGQKVNKSVDLKGVRGREEKNDVPINKNN